MTATLHLTHQLAQLSDSLKQTNSLISQLAKLCFQPGSEALSGDSSSTVRVELSQDIHDTLKQLEEDLELLNQEAEDLHPSASHNTRRRESSDRDRERARLSAQLARLGEDLATSRTSFRRAQLSAKKASETAKQKERELVFASLQNPPSSHQQDSTLDGNRTSSDLFAGRRALAQKSKLSKDELEVDASSTVTASLRRTHDLLSTELSRSRFAQETFDQSTAALADLGEGYASLEGVLSQSRNLLGTLLRSQKSDTWYLETAFYILIATLCWLVFRRILLGPFIRLPLFLIRWIFWKPFLLFLSVTGILGPASSAVGEGGGKVAGPRTPLIVQPSAKGSARVMSDKMAVPGGGRGVPAGAGGQGAKAKPAPEMVERIGRMAEESGREVEGDGKGDGDDGKVRRGDGTVLEDRGDIPKNPRKKVFDEGAPEGGQADAGKNEKDEL